LTEINSRLKQSDPSNSVRHLKSQHVSDSCPVTLTQTPVTSVLFYSLVDNGLFQAVQSST